MSTSRLLQPKTLQLPTLPGHQLPQSAWLISTLHLLLPTRAALILPTHFREQQPAMSPTAFTMPSPLLRFWQQPFPKPFLDNTITLLKPVPTQHLELSLPTAFTQQLQIPVQQMPVQKTPMAATSLQQAITPDQQMFQIPTAFSLQPLPQLILTTLFTPPPQAQPPTTASTPQPTLRLTVISHLSALKQYQLPPAH